RLHSFPTRRSSDLRPAGRAVTGSWPCVQGFHRVVPLALEQFGHHDEGCVDGFAGELLLTGGCLAQHEVHHLAGVAGVTDAEAQTGEILAVAEGLDDVPKTVVAAVA